MLNKKQRQIVPFCDGALMRVRNQIKTAAEIKFSEMSRGGDVDDGEPAARFNEPREAGQECAEESTSALWSYQFLSIKHESKHKAELAGNMSHTKIFEQIFCSICKLTSAANSWGEIKTKRT